MVLIAVSSSPLVSFDVSIVSVVSFRSFDSFGGSGCFGGFVPEFRALVHAIFLSRFSYINTRGHMHCNV